MGVVTGCDPNGSLRGALFAVAQPLRPMTVTSGGRTTGSSPGSTPVSEPEVARHGTGSDPGRRLGPGVDHLEPGVADEGGEQCTDVGVAGVGQRERRAVDPPRRGDGLLCHHPPAGPDGAGHLADDRDGLEHVQQQEAAEREVDLLGQREILAGLRERDDLRVGGCGACDLVPRQGVAVDRVDTTVPADHLGQRHRDVAASGTDVDATPTGTKPEAQERRGQRAAVDVVAQPLQLTHGAGPRPTAPPWLRTLRGGRGPARRGDRWRPARPSGGVTGRWTGA